MSTTSARTSEDAAYNMLKALEMAFNDYKSKIASSFNWATEKSAIPPYDAPAHDGAVRCMKEKGYWTAESEAWQNARSARLAALIEAWDNARAALDDIPVTEKTKVNRIKEDRWPAF